MLLASALVPTPTLAGEPYAKGSFVEEFDRLDEARWYVSDGWTNGDHQNCGWSRRQISVENGVLRLGFAHEPAASRAFSCAEVQTHLPLGFGTYEARLKTPARASGLNAAFFTFIGPAQNEPHDEIDFEFLLKDPSRVQLNSFVSGQGGNEYFADLAASAGDGFADYAIVWEPGRITWYIEGRQVHRLDDPAKVPSHPSKIYLSLWGSDTLGDWMGPFEDPGQPVAMEVDRIAFTAAGEPCQFEGSLVCADASQPPGRSPPANEASPRAGAKSTP